MRVKPWKPIGVIAAALAVAAIVAEPPPAREHPSVTVNSAEPFDEETMITPLPATVSVDPTRRDLGRRLFHDPILSRDGTISCASCHVISEGGDDGMAVSVGIDGAVGDRNAPTVLNAGWNFRQFWDGRAADLETQVDGPIHNPIEMDSSWDDITARLTADGTYRDAFLNAYGDVPRPEHVRHAIASFERTLVTPNSPFDRYLSGEQDALSPAAREGWRLFQSLGCIACHQGQNVGGSMFQRIGVIVGDEPTTAGAEDDLGRYLITGKPRDRRRFKVPSLRNVALTAPYFHDGSTATLEDAVRRMARLQIGSELDADQVASLVAFLESLTGELPAQ